MNQIEYPTIQTNPQFERLQQPPGINEYKNMQNDLLNNPESRLIHTWNGEHLLDSYKFEMCKELHLPIKTKEMGFANYIDAALYICNKELLNPHLTSEYKKFLIGETFRYRILKSDRISKNTLAEKMANALCMSPGTILKYHLFSIAMNTIFDQNTVFAQKILLEKIKVSQENAIELSRLKPDEIKSVANAVETDNVDHISISYIRNEVKWSYIQDKSPITRREKAENKLKNSVSIRQMPAYNPDSEANSLYMTIDSWISSIQRVHNSDNFQKISSKASLQLMQKLTSLEHSVKTMQESLVERTNS